MTFPVTRETLYEEIWAEPAVTVAARYGVTSTFLAPMCTEMNVPRPARGHWAKVAVNKTPKRPPLPPANPGDAVEWTRGQALRRERRALPVAPERRRRAKIKTNIPTDGPHPVVAEANRDFLNSRRAADCGHLRPFRRALPDLYVSPHISTGR